MIDRLIATDLLRQISNLSDLIAIELFGCLIILLKFLFFLLHFSPYLIHFTNCLLELSSLDALDQRIVLEIFRMVIVRAMIQLRFHHLSADILQSSSSKGSSLDQWIRWPRTSLALWRQSPRSNEWMQRRSCQIGLSLRSLGDGLQTDPFLPGVIELILDDSKQPLIKLE